jgi:hypothetical protein
MLKQELIDLSDKVLEFIKDSPGVSVLPTEDFGWENYRFYSSNFRLAHVERYFEDGLLVLHITCFPHANDGSPIYGFDVVGSEKTGKITGAFVDWSPVLYDHAWHDTEWSTNRILPEWATIFSERFVAIRPEPEEHSKLFNFAFESFQKHFHYLEDVSDSRFKTKSVLDQIRDKQNTYCEHQSNNPRTFAALSHKVGEERARYFMKEILFPKC